MDKICMKCRQTKDTSEFAQNASRKDGFHHSCKECHKQYAHNHYKNNKEVYLARTAERNKAVALVGRAFLAKAKDVPCKDCGMSYPSYVMDFDHVHGQKVNNVGNMARDGVTSKLLDEMAKCDVVCANCHRIRTYDRKRPHSSIG